MTKAFVLMTALPPTFGHLDLIQFAGNLFVDQVTVLLNTDPREPLARERYYALSLAVNKLALGGKIHVLWQNEEVQQEPTDPDDQAFWDDWVANLVRFGFEPGDYIVASEQYGVRLAAEARGRFMPYDRDRWVRYTKGTKAREDYLQEWSNILPEFRHNLQKKVTIFGAESTGKTTLTESLASDAFFGMSTKLFEWARPFLEMTGPEVTREGMYRIWEGQYALQASTYENALKPLVIQDTDLFTTIGFWEDWEPDTVPQGIYPSARETQSDLYILTKSNIPFEHDILRYGGDERQTSDEYWLDICARHGLNYIVLDGDDPKERLMEASEAIWDLLEDNPLTYKRIGAEYA